MDSLVKMLLGAAIVVLLGLVLNDRYSGDDHHDDDHPLSHVVVKSSDIMDSLDSINDRLTGIEIEAQSIRDLVNGEQGQDAIRWSRIFIRHGMSPVSQVGSEPTPIGEEPDLGDH